MREIKFRAWLEGTHDNLTIPKPVMEYGVVLSTEGNYLSVEAGWDIQGEYPTIPVMQFTGLKDKNGIEIYDGDILSKTYSDDLDDETETVLRKVIWDKNHACFILSNAHVAFDVYKCIVVGNIYENPELFKKEEQK